MIDARTGKLYAYQPGRQKKEDQQPFFAEKTFLCHALSLIFQRSATTAANATDKPGNRAKKPAGRAV
jgi:hypothetical protein